MKKNYLLLCLLGAFSATISHAGDNWPILEEISFQIFDRSTNTISPWDGQSAPGDGYGQNLDVLLIVKIKSDYMPLDFSSKPANLVVAVHSASGFSQATGDDPEWNDIRQTLAYPAATSGGYVYVPVIFPYTCRLADVTFTATIGSKKLSKIVKMPCAE